MQRPRRTTEFHEEPGTATKRNSRSTQHRQAWVTPPAAGHSNRLSNKQSRITRPSSMDRQTLGLPNSALRGSRTTPMKTLTPSGQGITKRVLFTAEKKRNAHNDKKWVQERSQQIAEHLCDYASAPGAINGLPSEFFGRAGCLRQLQTKQFVAIVNYFLHFIWGNRFTVGSNYVDDIVNILQKLQYPHQVNKSWLKTINTSHSFGYVIQLFDFLIDFAPPKTKEEEAEKMFEIEEPREPIQIMNEEQCLQTPDANFTALTLKNSEEGFVLWDRQQMEEFENLQQQTCDELIFKRCGLQGVSALDAQLQELEQQLAEEQQRRPRIRKEDEEQCDQLQKEYIDTQQQLELERETHERNTQQMKDLKVRYQQSNNKVMHLEEEVAHIRRTLAKQTLTVEQRDAFIEDVAQHKYTLQHLKRTCNELRDRQHHQQVLVSRCKKQLIDKISKFNNHIREVSHILLHCNVERLQLPHNPQQEDVQERIIVLEELRELTKAQLQKTVQQQHHYEKHAHDLMHNTVFALEGKCAELMTTLKSDEYKAKERSKQAQHKCFELNILLKQQQQLLQKLQTENQHKQETKHEKQTELIELQKQNEELISRAEQEYKTAADERELFLNDYETTLKQQIEVLSKFSEVIQQREIELKQFMEEQGSATMN